MPGLRARRTLSVIGLLLAVSLVLAGCGSSKGSKSDSSSKPVASPSVGADGCTTYSPGKTSDSVTVTGAFGTTQTAKFKTPLNATGLERTLVTKGTGAVAKSGEDVDTLLSVFLGSTGKSLGSQPATLTVGDSQILQAFGAAVDCVPTGSRVVVTAPAKDVYGDQGNPQLGITAKDTIVIVTDVIGQKPQLKPQAWKSGVPNVTFAANGKPKLTLPKSAPPKQLLLKVLKPGKGAVVGKGDQVTLDYQGTSWTTGKIFDQSYGKQPATFGTGDVVPGFGAALIGQKVGTRLVVSIPPKYAYGEKGSGQQLSGQTLVFVIEIKKSAKS